TGQTAAVAVPRGPTSLGRQARSALRSLREASPPIRGARPSAPGHIAAARVDALSARAEAAMSWLTAWPGGVGDHAPLPIGTGGRPAGLAEATWYPPPIA